MLPPMTSPVSLEAHRPALFGHCYRMLGSAAEAEDAVQETLVRGWHGLERFEGRSSLKTWLYRIATNVCLDVLRARRRRFWPSDFGASGKVGDVIEELPREHWLEPVPDALALPDDADPAARALLRERIRLAFVAVLQELPPRQRAALLLSDVLGWSAAEVAEALETSSAAVNSALQRARATLASRSLDEKAPPLDEESEALLSRYQAAFEAYDVEGLAAMLRSDAVFSMPPITLWLEGPERVTEWLHGPGAGCRGSRLLPTAANGQPAFAQYRLDPEGRHQAWGLIVLELREGRIAAWTTFLDAKTLFPLFGLPLQLEER